MKVRVNTIGTDEQYGERCIILDDDQLGEIAVREMTVDGTGELVRLLDEVDSIEITESNWDKYDANITLTCR